MASVDLPAFKAGDGAVANSPEPIGDVSDSNLTSPRPSDYTADFLARAAIAAAFCLLAIQTWARWGDLQIDCGREVYVPY